MKSIVLTLSLLASTVASAAGEPKLYVIGSVTGTDKGAALTYVAKNGLNSLVYQCKQKIQGRKGLENLSGSDVWVIGSTPNGTTEKWSAVVAVAKGSTAFECVRKVINENTANFKNF